jgi:hypothetical protein
MYEVDWEYPEDNHGFRFFFLENIVHENKRFKKVLMVLKDEGVDIADVTASRWQLRLLPNGNIQIEHPVVCANNRREQERNAFSTNAESFGCFAGDPMILNAFNIAQLTTLNAIHDSEQPPEERQTQGPNRAKKYDIFKIGRGMFLFLIR